MCPPPLRGMRRARAESKPGRQSIPGIGPTLGAVLVAEIGDITRFASASKLPCWAGLTPKHHESDTQQPRGTHVAVRRAPVPAGALTR